MGFLNNSTKLLHRQTHKLYNMKCKQFNSIRLEEVLCSIGQLPSKQNEKKVLYLNPFISETQSSANQNKKNEL